MLSSPSHAVIGATDLDKMAAYFERFGFEPAAGGVLGGQAAAALYGLDGETEERLLSVPGAARGWLRLVKTPGARRETGPFDSRPIAVDIYTRDIETSLALAREGGYECGELVGYDVGPLKVKEAEIIGPDHTILVFIEANVMRPCVLADQPDRLHSELHSMVWAVRSAADVLPTWTEQGGLRTLIDTEFGGPIISKLMNLPKPEVPVRFVLMCDAEETPARFELIEFLEENGAEAPAMPLAGGLHAVGFSVDDLDAAMAALRSCEFDDVVELDTGLHPGATAVGGLAPGGIRFELWQEGRR